MTGADPAAPAPERRLHPWSWLFVLLQQLRQFIVPLVALVVFGNRDEPGGAWATIVPAVVVALLGLLSVLRYFTYRYRIGRDGLTVRDGWLHRSVREIPYARIHNVVVHQSLLHRLFGVAELRLESAGGQKPEAQMRVLKLDEALLLERQIKSRGAAQDDMEPAAAAQDDTLLALSPLDIVRLGIVSNRGMVLFAAAFGAAWQAFPDRMLANLFERAGRELFGYASHLHLGWFASAAAALALLLVAVLALRALSIVLAFVQYHGFRLSEARHRLTVERGLFTRVRTSVARRRIQAWTLHEGVLQRLLRRRSLHIDTAIAEQHDGSRDRGALKELAPIATAQACDALVRHLLPGVEWPRAHWQPVSRSAAWRSWLPGAALAAALAAAACWRLDNAWGLLALLWWPWSAFLAYQRTRRIGYAHDDRLVAVRGGWWSRTWRFAEIDKLQALRFERSPLDRRCGTASLSLDTSGASPFAPPLRIAYVPFAQAQALYDALSARMAGRMSAAAIDVARSAHA